MPGNLFAFSHRMANNKTIRSLLLKLRFPLGIFLGILLAMYSRREWFILGLAISLAGALWQSWCFGALDKRKTLAVSGPYCLVRNPMYLGRYFLLLGELLFLKNYWMPVVFTMCFYFYMVNRVKREEPILRGIFGQDYEDYCTDVRRFLPSLRRFRWRTLLFFRWKLFLANNGHLQLSGLLVFYGVCAYFAYSNR